MHTSSSPPRLAPRAGQRVPRTVTVQLLERALLVGVAALALLAWLLPAAGLPADYHHFADQRSWLGVPHAADVLSNLPFALMGVWGWWQWRRVSASAWVGKVGAAQRALVVVFFAGLLLTALGSSVYHWAPHDQGLCIDRLGMSLAFAGLLGLAAADRIGARAGWALAAFVAVAAPLSAVVALAAGNMTPWAVLQGGGLLLLGALALCRPAAGALGFSIGTVIAVYAAAKGMELADASLFTLTDGWLSGHSAKHLVAALAAWPVVQALQRLQARAAQVPAPLTMR